MNWGLVGSIVPILFVVGVLYYGCARILGHSVELFMSLWVLGVISWGIIILESWKGGNDP